jgi:hypothetical protein
MCSLRSLTRSGMTCGIVAVLLCSLSPGLASAQSQVKGDGVNFFLHGAPDGGNLFQQISVNAWLDNKGVAHGKMTWEGDNFQPLPGGRINPSNPYIMDVLDLSFVGNTAVVFGVVTASPQSEVNGSVWWFTFTDNIGTGEPDEINGVPIDAGNIIVR